MAVADAGSGGETAGGAEMIWILAGLAVLCVVLVIACCWIAGEGR